MSVEWILSSCAMIVLVVLIRYIFRRRIQPHVRYALWFAVAIRLLIPVSFSQTAVSILNFLPAQAEAEIKQEDDQIMRRLEHTMVADSETDFGIDTGTDFSAVLGEVINGVMIKDSSKSETKKDEALVPWEDSLLSKSRLDISRMFRLIWSLGAVFCSIILLAVNLDYARRLRRSRKRIDGINLQENWNIPVYTTEIIATPCLFGLFYPAVYMTEEVAKEEQAFTFVLCHENVHYRHCDHWWVFVRNLCLCLHWYNPLVWLAAYLSRQDGELACDEKVLEVLGDGVRVDYGRILLELSTAKFSGLGGWRLSTAMGGSKRQLSERLQMIIDAPGKALGAKALVLILMVFVLAVAFTGRNRQSLAAEGQEEDYVEADAEEDHVQAETEESVQMPEQEDFQQVQMPEKEDITDEQSKEEIEPAGDMAEGFERIYQSVRSGENLVLDLNFDGYDDLCLPGQYNGGENMPYHCMLWNQQTHEYEKSVMLYNVGIDKENEWVTSRVREENGRYSTTYYRYDGENQLHMVRYVEEDFSPDAVFEKLDLTYVENDDSIYMLPAIVDETDFHRTLLAMAKQALTELYQWTGEKIDTACFEVSNMGDVFFGVTPEDVRHSRIFYDRAFGADTAYNLSEYEKSISSMYVPSGRSVWYSPVLWRVFPDQIEKMTDEEVIIWYFERTPLVKNCKVKSIEKRYEDMWTVQAEDGVWFEVVYDVKLREVTSIYGPYPDYPVH